MNASISCSCGCSPCVCATPPAGVGCISEFCAPRPCFFPGQLVTSDDLNAVVSYFRAQESILAKLAAGWGVMGGMRLLQSGSESLHIVSIAGNASPQQQFPVEIFPNPQLVPGTRIQVSAGTAIDNAGRVMSLCAPQTIDILELSRGLGVPQRTEPASYWFGDLFPHDSPPATLTAAQYWVVAEYQETPARPMPRLAGGGACDPVPACDFSRRLESVRIRLVPDLPMLYFLHGCLDPVSIPGVEYLFSILFDELFPALISLLNGSASPPIVAAMTAQPPDANSAMAELFDCAGYKLFPQLFEYLNQFSLSTCCPNPAVALGRVLLVTEAPDDITSSFTASYPYYVFIDDAFPYRRLVPNGATDQMLFTTLLSILTCDMNH